MDTSIDVPSLIWGDELPSTPVLVGNEDALRFVAIPGRNATGPTTVLACSYEVYNPLLDFYGGQLPAPIHVVALDKETGGVYCAPLLGPKSPPVRILVPENETPSTSSSSQKAAFNVDFPALLGLPTHEASYDVFLWLDNLVSPVVSAAVPRNDNRQQTVQLIRKPDSLVIVGSPVKPSGTNPATLLDFGVTVESGFRFVHLFWKPGTNYRKDKPYPIVLIGLCHRERSLGLVSFDCNSRPEAANGNHFTLNVNELAGASKENENVFLVGFSIDQVPMVLTVAGVKEK